jgi:pyruvate/2-oxoacid:ferredoxin oxidoreductase beta subunit
MDAPTTGQLLTVAGNAVVTSLLCEVFWRTLNPSPEVKDRFGPLVAAGTGIALALVALIATTGFGAPYASIVDAFLIGLTGGLAAIGVHDVSSR